MIPNFLSSAIVRHLGNDIQVASDHYSDMPNKEKDRKPGWFAAEWLELTGVSQADIVRSTGWSKGRISDLVNGKERFNEDVLYAFAKEIGCPPGALVDVDPSTDEGRTLAQILLSGPVRKRVAR